MKESKGNSLESKTDQLKTDCNVTGFQIHFVIN